MAQNLKIEMVEVQGIKESKRNPRQISKSNFTSLERSLKEFDCVEPIIVNRRDNQIIGGHQRFRALIGMGEKKVPVIYVDLDKNKAKMLNLALNRIKGEWDEQMLSELIYELDQDKIDLSLTGFDNKELDNLLEETMLDIPESFDLAKEVKKMGNMRLRTKVGDMYELGDHKLLCGDSTKEEDIQKLMGVEKVDFCFTDPPYALEYLRGKYKGTLGFGYKTNRRYLTTETAPKFEDWLPLVHKVAKRTFNIIVFENWKNVIPLWEEMAKYWKVKNMIIWHLTNRCQGFAGKHYFFNKYDIAMMGSSEEKIKLNLKDEGEDIQNEYEIALYAIGGKAYFDISAMKGKYFASDHIDFKASDATSSGQSIIFGTKPVEILIPYIKILSKKGDIILEPFGGSGSTMIAAEKLKRRCFVMEKTPLYTDVIIARFEKFTGKKAKRI